jgi:hypothetical protein
VADLPDWHPDVAGVPEPKPRKRGKRTFEPTLYYGKLTLVADETYPHLFRIHYPDGLISPPANLTRAKDAARDCARSECLQRAAVSTVEEIELAPTMTIGPQKHQLGAVRPRAGALNGITRLKRESIMRS